MAPKRVAEETVPEAGSWHVQNLEQIHEAECIIGARLANKKHFDEHTDTRLCDEIFNNILKSNLSKDNASSDNSSVLLLGETGAGKTHVVEYCLKKLREARDGVVVLRAYGGAYVSDVECIRHLATQITDRFATAPSANASFEQGMEWIRSLLKESIKHASAVVVVLDKFEHFCTRSRQTLLYNLFDVAQEVGTRLSIIGTSEKMNVMDFLEKRIKSRFSMRHLYAFWPTNMDDLVKLLMAKLSLPKDCGLKAPFVKVFHTKLQSALYAKAGEWRPQIEFGRPPSWFLARCLPLYALFHDAAEVGASSSSALAVPSTVTKPAKRGRFETAPGCLPSAAAEEIRALRMDSFDEPQHIILLVLYHLRDRPEVRTMATVMNEIELLHSQEASFEWYNEDKYACAFARLVQERIVEFGPGSGDLPKRYLPCESNLDKPYAAFVADVCKGTGASPINPLRNLSLPVRRWVEKHRPKELPRYEKDAATKTAENARTTGWRDSQGGGSQGSLKPKKHRMIVA